MSTVLIVGASQGLGLEWVKYYKSHGYNIIATTRDANAASELQAILTPKDQLLPLDVTQGKSVITAISQFTETPDITIYNAGVKGYTKHDDIRATIANAQLVETNHDGKISSRESGINLAFQVNAYGFDRIMYALKEQLLNKYQAVVVYVSTGVANIMQNTSGGYPFYRESKVAGEAFVRSWYLECLSQATIESCPRIFSIIPGLVNIGMGKNVPGAVAPMKRVTEMAAIIDQVKYTGDTHGVWKYDGTKLTIYELPESEMLNTPS